MKREPDVCVVHPFRVSHVAAGTGLSPFSHSLGGCPCGQAEGRRLEQEYLCESACHWWLVPITELKSWEWGGLAQIHLFISTEI